MRTLAAVTLLALAACHGGPTIVEEPVELEVIEVPVPVPGETRVVEIPVPVGDHALVRLLLAGLGEIGSLECVPTHSHAHREEVCGIVSRTLEAAQGLP